MLGRGAMGTVFRARDERNGRAIAVKRMQMPAPSEAAAAIAQFEREFHTLAGVKHPCIVSVFDYGLDEAGPYYTMELLAGADLHELNRAPWDKACEILRDVASALAILHSRRLLHCDLSARNVRCDAEGRSKLIDFGAMAPMGFRRRIMGTPPFLAPETLDLQALDARADLFALGALAYRLITGRHAYPAREISDLPEIWSNVVRAPAEIDPGVPAALSDLVMQLISVDRTVRPSQAAEVMERLCAIAGLSLAEGGEVTRAYLTLPALVGREHAAREIGDALRQGKEKQGGALVVEGESGLGRSRMLDVGALQAKLLGATVLRAQPVEQQSGAYQVVKALGEQLLEAMPRLAEDAGWLRTAGIAEPSRREYHATIRDFFIDVSRSRHLVLAIDDFDGIDETSASILAALAHHCERRSLNLLVALPPRPASGPARVVQGIARRVELLPLDESETETLVRSLFGDADNAVIVARHIQQRSSGNPRVAMELAQDLIDRKLARYEAGSFILPHQLDASDLSDGVCGSRLAGLSEHGKEIVECLALGDPQALLLEDYPRLFQLEPAQIYGALDELTAKGLVVPAADHYVFSRPGFAESIAAQIAPEKRRALHARLASFAERADHPIGWARHLLEAGEIQKAVDVVRTNRRHRSFAPSRATIELFARLNAEAEGLTLPRAHRVELKLQLVFASSLLGDIECFSRYARPLLAELKRDSGLDDWEALGAEGAEEPERLGLALARAEQRHSETPELERGLDIRKAIAQLARLSLSFSSMATITMDAGWLVGLPSFQPFAALAPALSLLEQSIAASREFMTLHPQRAREHALAVLAKLVASNHAGLDETRSRGLRFGLLYMLGAIDAIEGNPDAAQHVAELESVPGYRATAWKVRRVAHLMQGDFDRARACQRTAELFDLEDGEEQAFPNTALRIEACARWMVGDLVGLKQVAERIQDLAQVATGWQNTLRVARSHYKRLQGDAEASISEILPALANTAPGADPDWSWVVAAHVAALSAAGRHQEAAELGLAYHEAGERAGLGSANGWVVVPMAAALVQAGRAEAAVRVLDAHIAALEAIGTKGLRLGLAYEGRAYAAIAVEDQAAFNLYASRCATEYRRSKNSTLIASYQRLMRAADASAISVAAGLDRAADFTTMSGRGSSRTTRSGTAVDRVSACVDASERARTVLSSLLEPGGSSAGYLYAMRGGKLELVACLPDGASPPSELARRIERYVLERTEESGTMTLHVVEPAVQPESGVANADNALTCVAGYAAGANLLRPVALTTVLDGKKVVAAVAALGSGEGNRVLEPAVVSALATLLVQHHDVDPVTCVS